MSPTPPSQSPWRVLGGPLGSHTSARSASAGRAARLAVALVALPVLIALGLRSWCLSHGFTGQVPLWRACYSDLPALLGNLQLGAPTGDPVVTAAALRAVAGLVDGASATDQSRFVIYWAFLALVLLAVCAVAITAYRSERALLFVLCPALPLGLLISGDVVGVTLLTVGLVAWSLRADTVAGVALALAGFSRGVAVIAVVALILLAVREGRALRRFGLGLGGGILGAVGLGLLTGVAALVEPLTRWWDAVPSYGSVWVLPAVASTTTSSSGTLHTLLSWLGGAVLPPAVTTVISVLGWLLAIAVVWWLSRRPSRPSTADLTLVGAVIVLLTSPALPVQASLWLVPLVALSSLPWRDMLIWACIEVVYFPMVWLYLGGLENAERGLPGGWYLVFLGLRVLAIGYLAWRVLETSRFGPRSSPDPSVRA